MSVSMCFTVFDHAPGVRWLMVQGTAAIMFEYSVAACAALPGESYVEVFMLGLL